MKELCSSYIALVVTGTVSLGVVLVGVGVDMIAFSYTLTLKLNLLPEALQVLIAKLRLNVQVRRKENALISG